MTARGAVARTHPLAAPSVERRLCDLFGYAHAVLFGRARSGLVALVKIVSPPGAPALFPSNVCPAVLAALVAAGAKPSPVAVSPTSGLVAPARFLEAMKSQPQAGVVIPTHLYGLWAPCADLLRRGWFVLESDTLATAAVRAGSRRAVGDALLVSFNQAKTIEAGMGGAVLTDDRALAAELARIASDWPPLSAQDVATEEQLMLARRHLRALGRGALGESLFDLDVAAAARRFSDDARDGLAHALDAFPQAIAAKWKRVELWERALAGVGAELLAPEAELAVPWRLTRRLRRPALRDGLVAQLRAKNFDAGVNYPALSRDFPGLAPRHADSAAWADSVVNLWLSEDYDAARIAAGAVLISDFFDAAR